MTRKDTNEAVCTARDLIRKYVVKSNHLYNLSAYSLKHLFEQLAHTYFSEQEFISVMQEEGYTGEKRSGSTFFRIRLSKDKVIPPFYRGAGGQSWKYLN